MLRDVFRATQCQLKNKRKYRAISLLFPSILILLVIVMCLAPKLWEHSPPAVSYGDGNLWTLGQLSLAMQKRQNVSELLSAFVWTDDDIEMDRQLIDLVRDFISRSCAVPNQASRKIHAPLCILRSSLYLAPVKRE